MLRRSRTRESMCPVDSETPDLGTLIDDWLDWSEAGKALGVSVSKVRQLIREHQLAAAVPSPGAGQQVPAELIAMDNVVLFPHLGSASEYTRRAMDQLVVDNLLAWFSGKPPLTPVPETPYPPQKRG